MTTDDLELVREAQRGNTHAFEQLVQRHDRQVLAIAARYVTSSDEAKDKSAGKHRPHYRSGRLERGRAV